MSGKTISKIAINVEKCSGCRICQFICAYTYHDKFAPELAHVRIICHELMPQITFLEECTNCGICARHCLYGALSLVEAEE
ncbi:MAG: hypothetical protein ACTSRW_15340 [Candidatus Helarchaeota archaeon]